MTILEVPFLFEEHDIHWPIEEIDIRWPIEEIDSADGNLTEEDHNLEDDQESLENFNLDSGLHRYEDCDYEDSAETEKDHDTKDSDVMDYEQVDDEDFTNFTGEHIKFGDNYIEFLTKNNDQEHDDDERDQEHDQYDQEEDEDEQEDDEHDEHDEDDQDDQEVMDSDDLSHLFSDSDAEQYTDRDDLAEIDENYSNDDLSETDQRDITQIEEDSFHKYPISFNTILYMKICEICKELEKSGCVENGVTRTEVISTYSKINRYVNIQRIKDYHNILSEIIFMPTNGEKEDFFTDTWISAITEILVPFIITEQHIKNKLERSRPLILKQLDLQKFGSFSRLFFHRMEFLPLAPCAVDFMIVFGVLGISTYFHNIASNFF